MTYAHNSTKASSHVYEGGADKHGCSTDGGYSWCSSEGKCVRPWLASDACKKEIYPTEKTTSPEKTSSPQTTTSTPKTSCFFCNYQVWVAILIMLIIAFFLLR